MRTLFAALLLAAACRSEERAASSSTILFDEARGLIWVTSPDDDRLIAIDPDTLEVQQSIAVFGAPEQVAFAGDALIVTHAQSSSVALVDPSSGSVRAVATPCGGTRGLAVDGSSPGPTAWITCPNDDLILALDPAAEQILERVAAPGRPTAVAISGDRMAVTASREGSISVFTLDGEPSMESSRDYGESRGLSASQLDVLSAGGSGSGFMAAFQLVDHDTDRGRAPELGGYGSVIADMPRIAPRLAADGCGGIYARFNGGARVASGPSAIAYAPGTDTVWIANRYTDNVVVIDCAPDGGDEAPELSSETPPLVAVFRTGRGPRGIAVRSDGRAAFVDVGFDHAVARIELDDLDAGDPDLAPRDPALARARDLGPTRRFSPIAAEGRALFFDASNTHLTPSGVVTCGTCHPDGGEDGLAWFLHTEKVPRKLRRTPPAWAAKSRLAPFHWDGEFTDAGTLARATIVELMEGDGLVVDVSAIAAYLDELPPPPPRPIADRARWDAGRMLFEGAAECASCHPAPLFADAQQHAVLDPSLDPDGDVAATDTPSLLAIRARPPYLHDGRAETLRAVLTAFNPGDAHGKTAALSPEDLDLLIEYLESL